jgi:quercetin dioxygenase-like cupin family protein
VITGLDAQGRSCFLFDGPSDGVVWSTETVPADNSGSADAGAPALDFPKSGSVFLFHDFPPHSDIMMHATNTIDYIVVVSGQITFITEAGETLLRTGDVLVDRGHYHGWRNDSDQPCRIINVLCASHPVGKGATI